MTYTKKTKTYTNIIKKRNPYVKLEFQDSNNMLSGNQFSIDKQQNHNEVKNKFINQDSELYRVLTAIRNALIANQSIRLDLSKNIDLHIKLDTTEIPATVRSRARNLHQKYVNLFNIGDLKNNGNWLLSGNSFSFYVPAIMDDSVP
jgi:hypothetical protein